MNLPDENNLSEKEKDAFDALRANASTPSQLQAEIEIEEAVVQRLRAAGILSRQALPPLISRAHLLLRIAALLLLAAAMFGGGIMFSSGSKPAAQHETAQSQFLLLLYETHSSASNTDPATHAALVQEYAAWANELQRRGRLVSAGELQSAGTLLGVTTDSINSGEPRSNQNPVGYFLIQAGNQDDAVRVAQTCPHLKHGGKIVVRPVS